MEYNTERTKLSMPEYGRNLQLLIDFVVEIPDKSERTEAAYTLVNLFAQQNPQMRNQPEFMQKLWNHVFIMSGYKLDVDSPFPKPDPEFPEKVQRERVAYPKKDFKYRFYGKNVELMIQKCIEMEDGELKTKFLENIGSYMRMAYKLYNDERVADAIILGHLTELSKGQLKLEKIPEAVRIAPENQIPNKEPKKFKQRIFVKRKNRNYSK